MKRKTFLNLLLILFIVSFFVTPLGEYNKVILYRLFAATPTSISVDKQEKIATYNWKLKDENHKFINFKKSKGKVVFVNMWASWITPCTAELHSIQKLYDTYKDEVDFYIITNEEIIDAEKFMQKKKFTFPVTYLLLAEEAPLETENVPATYILDKNGTIVVHQKDGIGSWNKEEVHTILDKLIE